ncbi:hypothetical protein SRHO_G00245420 [Serrasalmus rhombeus]
MDILNINVLGNSTDTAVFRIHVECTDPVLLRYWIRKGFFYNREVQQTDLLVEEDYTGLEFVLRVLHRCSRLPNDYYLSPFLITLCLDALVFNYQLPQRPDWDGTIREAMRGNCLQLRR